MAKKGPDAVTMRNIAADAGLTTGALTHYFDGKRAIVSAALELICSDMLDRLRKAPATTRDELLELLELALPLDADQRDDWRVWLAFWARAEEATDALRIYNQQFRSSWLQLLGLRMAELTTAGEIHMAEDPTVVAARIAHVLNGIALEACLDPDAWPPERQRAELDAIVAPMLAG